MSQSHLHACIFSSAPHQCFSMFPCLFFFFFFFYFLLTWRSWHICYCFPWGCYQWAICVLLLALASCLSAPRHHQPPRCHRLTMSQSCDKSWRTKAFSYICVCVSTGLGDTSIVIWLFRGAVDKFAPLSLQREDGMRNWPRLLLAVCV